MYLMGGLITHLCYNEYHIVGIEKEFLYPTETKFYMFCRLT